MKEKEEDTQKQAFFDDSVYKRVGRPDLKYTDEDPRHQRVWAGISLDPKTERRRQLWRDVRLLAIGAFVALFLYDYWRMRVAAAQGQQAFLYLKNAAEQQEKAKTKAPAPAPSPAPSPAQN